MHIFKKEETESMEMLALLYARRRFILFTSLIIGLLSLATSLFLIPEKFQSEAIIYPTPSNSQEAILENPSFGFEGNANQLLQVLQSNILRDRLIENFQLASYYQIDTTRKDWYSRLAKKMNEDIRFDRTPYYSVSITAETKSPELSSNMVNFIVEEVNLIVQEIFSHNIEKTYLAYREEYLEQEIEVRKLLDSLVYLKQHNTDQVVSHLNTQIDQTYSDIQSLRSRIDDIRSSHSIYSYQEQVSLLSNQLANASAHYNHSKSQFHELGRILRPEDTTLLKLKADMLGARKNADTSRTQLAQLASVQNEYSELKLLLDRALLRYAELKSQKQNLENAYEPTIESAGLGKLQAELSFSQEQLQQFKARFEKARQKMENKLPSIYVVSHGRPSYKRSSPSHSNNTLLGLCLGLIFSTGSVLVKERWKKIKPQLESFQ